MAERPKTEPSRPRPPREEGPGPVARRFQSVVKQAIDRVVGNDWTTGTVFVVAFTFLLSFQQCGLSVPVY